MNTTSRILTAISATEPSSFGELCQALDAAGEKPDSKGEWAQLFRTLEMFEESELVEIERHNGKIDSLQLTALGAERTREALRGAERT